MRKHNDVLEEIATHPDIVGINKRDIFTVIKEVEILKYNESSDDQECDLVFLYDVPYNHSDLVEIKSDNAYPSSKAYRQLINTSRRFCDRIGYPVEQMKVLYYPSMRLEVLE